MSCLDGKDFCLCVFCWKGFIRGPPKKGNNGVTEHPSLQKQPSIGMFPLILTVLNRDYSTP